MITKVTQLGRVFLGPQGPNQGTGFQQPPARRSENVQLYVYCNCWKHAIKLIAPENMQLIVLQLLCLAFRLWGGVSKIFVKKWGIIIK